MLTQRRSPRAYADQPVPADVLHQVFAATSSASSCFDEQPWSFLVGTHAGSVEAYDKILTSQAEFNQPWTKAALMLVTSVRFPPERTIEQWRKPWRRC